MGDPKKNALMREASIAELSPWNRYGMVDEVVARMFYCPECGTMLSVDVQQKDEPIILDMLSL